VQLGSAALIAAGGWDGKQEVAAVEMYIPTANKWQRLTNMPKADSRFAAASISGVFYVVGTDVHAKYDVVKGEWQQIAPLNEPRHYLALVELNASLYAFGGDHGDPVSTTTERYDAQRDVWTRIAPLTVPRHGVAGCVWRVSAETPFLC
jgi:N-acetylneuraminic acid mutarotase